MFVYPVSYRIRSDMVLVRHKLKDDLENFDFRINQGFSFDDYFQLFSSEKFYQKQMNESLIFAIRNQIFSMFFCFSCKGSLHLFNSRAEVTRFLRNCSCDLYSST